MRSYRQRRSRAFMIYGRKASIGLPHMHEEGNARPKRRGCHRKEVRNGKDPTGTTLKILRVTIEEPLQNNNGHVFSRAT